MEEKLDDHVGISKNVYNSKLLYIANYHHDPNLVSENIFLPTPSEQINFFNLPT